MPRDKWITSDDATRAPGVRDRDLERAAGADDEDDEDEFIPDALPKILRARWPKLDLNARRDVLRIEIANKFRRRFGFGWDDRRAAFFYDPPWPPKRMPRQSSRGFASRPRLVTLLDYENQLHLPNRKDGSSRFLSVLEFTWVSILAGNWPSSARDAEPDAILRAERELMKKALFRYGQKPSEIFGRVRRGPQRHGKK